MVARRMGSMPYSQNSNVFGRLGSASDNIRDVSLASVGAKAGATAGSVVPGVGTAIGAAVGAVVGAVVGILTRTNNTASHIGSWDGGLTQAIAALPQSAAGIGRQFPWNENSHGLGQMIEALLATGIYMAWDSSLKSNYDVAAHWAMTFAAAVATVAQAIVSNPVGATVNLSITVQPGANHGPIPFSFVNPGIGAGPDRISATVIMGSSGLMYAIIVGCGETQTHAQSNANNGLAQKVFALMLDYQFAQLHPQAAQPATPAPPIAPIIAAVSTTANQVAATLPVQPPPMATTQPLPLPIMGAPLPVAHQQAVDNSAAMMQQMLAQGASQNAAMLAALQQLQSQGVNTQQPAVQQQLQAAVQPSGFMGMSNTELLLIGGAIVAVVVLSKKES